MDKFDDDDTENLMLFYEAVVRFINNGNLPRHIKAVTLNYYYAFGLKGFFTSDVEKIRGFANTLVILDFKLRHSTGFHEKFIATTDDIIQDEIKERNLELFKELVQVCLKIRDKFTDPGAEVQMK